MSESRDASYKLKGLEVAARNVVGQKKITVPKLSILSIVFGTFPLTGVYSRKALTGNVPRLSVKAFYEKDKT